MCPLVSAHLPLRCLIEGLGGGAPPATLCCFWRWTASDPRRLKNDFSLVAAALSATVCPKRGVNKMGPLRWGLLGIADKAEGMFISGFLFGTSCFTVCIAASEKCRKAEWKCDCDYFTHAAETFISLEFQLFILASCVIGWMLTSNFGTFCFVKDPYWSFWWGREIEMNIFVRKS